MAATVLTKSPNRGSHTVKMNKATQTPVLDLQSRQELMEMPPQPVRHPRPLVDQILAVVDQQAQLTRRTIQTRHRQPRLAQRGTSNRERVDWIELARSMLERRSATVSRVRTRTRLHRHAPARIHAGASNAGSPPPRTSKEQSGIAPGVVRPYLLKRAGQGAEVEVVVVGHGNGDEIAGDGLAVPLARRSLCLPWAVFAGAQDAAVLLESSHQGSCIAQVNDAFLSLSEHSHDEIIGADMDVLFAEAAHAAEVRSLWRQLGSEPLRTEVPLRAASGMRVPVEVELIPLLHADPKCCLVILRDLSEHHKVVAHAERADQRLRLATDVGRIGTWEWKPATGELEWDRWLRIILGVSDAERASHARWTELVHPLDRERAAADAQFLLAGALDEVEARYRIARPDGTAGQVLARTRVSERDERGVATCLIGVLLDITELHQAAEEREILLAAEKEARQAAECASQELARLASSDPLTGLANRHELNRWMNQALSANEQFVVMFFDLDRFKPVNDSHGHSVGDQVLIELARRLRIQVRPADLVARFGGDEFVVATVVATADEATRLARRLLHEVAQPVAASGVRVTLTASVGLALSNHTAEPETLLSDADLALYHAKNQGRNRAVWFHPKHRDLVVK